MFGYVQPLKPELRIKEYACYKSYYCGVCKALGRKYGPMCRFTVTYDAAFLALLNSSLMETEVKVCYERCIVNPFKPQPVVREHDAVNYAAMVNVLLIYYKLKDSWKDDKRILSLLGSSFIKPFVGRTKKLYPEVHRSIEELLNKLNSYEMAETPSIDEASDPFAKLLSVLLPFPGLERTANRVLTWMGYNLGKWIYVLDAFADIDEDLSSNSYNVLVARYGKGRSAEEIREKSREEVEFILRVCLTEIGKAYELLDIKRNSGLLENIIFFGLPNRTQLELNSGREKHGSIQGTRSKPKCNSGRDQESLSGIGEEIPS